MKKNYFLFLMLACFAVTLFVAIETTAQPLQKLSVSTNKRFLQTADGKPFFWLGETGWLLFSKLNREEAETFLEDRRQKGFNVVQVMVLHTLDVKNAYGDKALLNKNVATPKTTPGNSFDDSLQYDYWDHMDYIIDLAEKKGIYMGLVPVWGGNVKNNGVTVAQAKKYATFLAGRYKDKSNIIWLNGGDISGSDALQVWKTIGSTLHAVDNNHLITYHPRGRTTSSIWFHNEPWLDFNMFQSGHRNYSQDTTAKERFHYGEDNWKYVDADYKLKPTKPTIDGEPSYEAIPQGLHDTTEAYWTDSDVRRYGYWSVFAGGFGYTYGHNAVMQMYKAGDKTSYGPKSFWYDAIKDPGASQMIYLKELMLSKPFFSRVPDQTMVAGEPGKKYNRVVATRGDGYALFYTYNGRNFSVKLGKIKGSKIKAEWYNPRDGQTTLIGDFANAGVKAFDPPGEQKDGNDWVLVLSSE